MSNLLRGNVSGYKDCSVYQRSSSLLELQGEDGKEKMSFLWPAGERKSFWIGELLEISLKFKIEYKIKLLKFLI